MITLTNEQIDSVKEGECASRDIAIELAEKYSAIEIAIAFVEEVVFNECDSSNEKDL